MKNKSTNKNVDFNYYLDEAGNPKKMSAMNILQLSKTVDDKTLVREAHALLMIYHPDKNPQNKEKATTVTQMITGALEKLKDKKDNFWVSINEADDTSDDDESLEKFQKDRLETMKTLNQKLEYLKLLRGNEPSSEVIDPNDTYEAIAKEFRENYKQTMVPQDLGDIQHKVLVNLSDQAKTASENYELFLTYKSTDTFPLNKYEPLQKAAALGHPMAMFELAHRVLSGFFTPLKESVPWAFECLYYIDYTLLKEKSTSDSSPTKDLSDLSAGIIKLKNRRKPYLNKPIPMPGSKEFKELVDNFLKYRQESGGLSVAQFVVPKDMFKVNSEDKTLVINDRSPEDTLNLVENNIQRVWEEAKKSLSKRDTENNNPPDEINLGTNANPTLDEEGSVNKDQQPENLTNTSESPNVPRFFQPKLNNDNNIETFISNLKTQIETKSWKTGLGGKKITFTNEESTTSITVPAHIAEMHAVITNDSLSSEAKLEEIRKSLEDALNQNPKDSFLTKLFKTIKNLVIRNSDTEDFYRGNYNQSKPENG